MTIVHHRYAVVNGQRLFYRQAGPAGAPVVVLLHGFPASSFMFRHLIPLLADRYHVIAPDHLGFGLSDAPAADQFGYTFDALGDRGSASCDLGRSEGSGCLCPGQLTFCMKPRRSMIATVGTTIHWDQAPGCGKTVTRPPTVTPGATRVPGPIASTTPVASTPAGTGSAASPG
jgi:hypothetical protein